MKRLIVQYEEKKTIQHHQIHRILSEIKKTEGRQGGGSESNHLLKTKEAILLFFENYLKKHDLLMQQLSIIERKHTFLIHGEFNGNDQEVIKFLFMILQTKEVLSVTHIKIETTDERAEIIALVIEVLYSKEVTNRTVPYVDGGKET